MNAGVHFGHRTSESNPKMLAFIHSFKNGRAIINLDKTNSALETAYDLMREAARQKKKHSICWLETFCE